MASSVMISTNYEEKGLTLLEILVVLAIIGIVAAISVPNISGWTSSRTINNDLGELTKLIDYAKVNSVKEKKKFLLVNDNYSKSLNLYQSKNVDTSTNCTSYNSSTFEYASGYEASQKVTSNILAQRGLSRGYTDPSTELCFFSDGTVSTNTTGYEISYRDRSYRLSVWITGFYEVLRYSEVSCPAEKRAYDRDNNIIQNWCEVSQ